MINPDDNVGDILSRFDMTLEQHNRKITALEVMVKGLLKIFFAYQTVKLVGKALKK